MHFSLELHVSLRTIPQELDADGRKSMTCRSATQFQRATACLSATLPTLGRPVPSTLSSYKVLKSSPMKKSHQNILHCSAEARWDDVVHSPQD